MTKITSKKNKILIVGSFPKSNQKKIFGGQLTACKILINSKFSKKYRIYTLNSSYIKQFILYKSSPKFINKIFICRFKIIKIYL